MKDKVKGIYINSLSIACDIIKEHQPYDHQNIIDINFQKGTITMDDGTKYKINKCVDEWMLTRHY